MAHATPTTDPWTRHDPTATAVYDLVRANVASFQRFAEERSGRPLPTYVTDEFAAYLRCGVLACGFVRARCTGCGFDRLVAFSCKRRGACASCGARRMSETAANLVDRVLPDVPIRQWVLSAPWELRLPLARDPELLTALARIFFEEIRRWYRDVSGVTGRDDEQVEVGVITHVQRFGGSLNLNVHLHVLAADGVFRCREDGTTPAFIAGRAPMRDDLRGVLERVVARLERSLARKEARATSEEDALDACLRAASGAETFDRIRVGEEDEDDVEGARFDARGRKDRKPFTAEYAGFNVHAGVTITAHDREGRERLCRYTARPAVCLSRVSVLPDGRVAYRVKHPRSATATHRVMTSTEFMARLAALVPPPRHPLTRYHGVFAPNSPWRAAVVPGPRLPHYRDRARLVEKDGQECACLDACVDATLQVAETMEEGPEDGRDERPPRAERRGHRIDWATLLRRVWGFDVLACPRCGDFLRMIATITDHSAIVRILEHLGLSTDEPRSHRARDPTWEDVA